MGLLLALGAGISFGGADFVGGLAAKRAHPATVTVLSQLVGFAVLLGLLPLLPGTPSPTALGIGALAGIAGSLGLAVYLKALAAGPMGVVAPVTSVAGVAIPLVVGLAAGERLSAVATAGLIVGVLAIGVVAGGGGRTRPGTSGGPALALLGGVLVGTFLVLLDLAPDASGLWPLVGARLASLALFGTWALATRAALPPRAELRLIATSGALDMLANVLFLMAARSAPLTIASLLASLSPVVIALLARQVLAERLHRTQVVAVGLCLLAVAAVTTG